MATDRLNDLYRYLTIDEGRDAEIDAYRDYYEEMGGSSDASTDEVIDWWMGEDATSLPAWCHIVAIAIEDEQDLVHYTKRERADEIMRDGFRGIVAMQHVATSTAYRKSAYSADGFSFAFRVADVETGMVTDPSYFGGIDSIAIRFRARSLRVRSEFDGEEQSIFIAGSAIDIRREEA